MAEIKSWPNNQDEYVGAEYVMRWLHGRTSGVFAAAANAAVAAVQNEMAVTVSDGIGWLTDANANGIVWWNDTEKTTGAKLKLTISPADSTLNRYDAIIVKWETTNYVARPEIYVKKGTPAQRPARPSPSRTSILREIVLAWVYIKAGTTSITASMITDARQNTNVCGLVTDSLSIDTSVINKQFEALLAQLQQNIDATAGGALPDGAVTTVYTATLTVAGWTADATSGGYLQTVTVAGLLATDNRVLADINPGTAGTSQAAQIMAWDEAWSFVTGWTGAGQATVLFRDKPDIAIPIKFTVWRK